MTNPLMSLLLRRFDLFGILFGILGLVTIAISPAEQQLTLWLGLFITFFGAVIYGGIPGLNKIESAVTKIALPYILLGGAITLILWKMFGTAILQRTILTWAFGLLVLGTFFSSLIQNFLGD